MTRRNSNRVLAAQATLAGLAVILLLGVAAKAVQSPAGGSPPETVEAPLAAGSRPEVSAANAPQPERGEATLLGTIVEDGPNWMLRAESGKVYRLDSNEKLRAFEGKLVRVTGGVVDGSGDFRVIGITAANS